MCVNFIQQHYAPLLITFDPQFYTGSSILSYVQSSHKVKTKSDVRCVPPPSSSLRRICHRSHTRVAGAECALPEACIYACVAVLHRLVAPLSNVCVHAFLRLWVFSQRSKWRDDELLPACSIECENLQQN